MIVLYSSLLLTRFSFSVRVLFLFFRALFSSQDERFLGAGSRLLSFFSALAVYLDIVLVSWVHNINSVTRTPYGLCAVIISNKRTVEKSYLERRAATKPSSIQKCWDVSFNTISTFFPSVRSSGWQAFLSNAFQWVLPNKRKRKTSWTFNNEFNRCLCIFLSYWNLLRLFVCVCVCVW